MSALGVPVRSDVVDVYPFRRVAHAGGVEFLQLLRATEPLLNTWHPVMGHMHEGETAVRTALRELGEEVGLKRGDPGLVRMWALEQVHPFFIAGLNCIVLSPRFVVEVAAGWEPVLNEEHSALRWVRGDEPHRFVWPGQRAAVAEVMQGILRGGEVMGPLVEIDVRE
jgi:8-oxo-dGTP pyrophosphatase MutT (NUDIX family)